MLKLTVLFLVATFVSCQRQAPDYPLWPDGFKTTALITAFDEESQPHVHRSLFYYSYVNDTTTGKAYGLERHDHYGYCYGWAVNQTGCTILIIGNVYIIATNLCCNAMPGNYGVPRDWLKSATWLGTEQVNGKTVEHWYAWEHEYWHDVSGPRNGIRYSGPNFKTPRQFTDYDTWVVGPQDPSLFELPKDVDCSQPCP